MTSPASERERAALHARIGGLLTVPREALRAIEARGGGLRDALVLVALGALCLRFREMARASLGLVQVSAVSVLQRILGAALHEVNEAAIVILAAAVGVTILAGRGRREPTLDLELGAACYVPFFVVRAVYRVAAHAWPSPVATPAWEMASYAAGGAWAAIVLGAALSVARSRVVPPPGTPDARAPDSAAPPLPRSARRAGLAVAALLAAALMTQAVWVGTHVQALRPMRRGQTAPAFVLPRGDGTPGTLALGNLRGRVVLLDFWATWCNPCVKMLPVLDGLAREWGSRGLTILGVNTDGLPPEDPALRSFLREHGPAYPMVIDVDGRVADAYKVQGLPHIVLIDRGGTVRKVFWGYTTHGELVSAVRQAIDTP